LKGTFNAAKTVFTCNDCKRWRKPYHWKEHFPEYLPVWYNDDGQAQFHVPECLKDLREGEKLLIQQISPYVPLEHLKQGAHACVGHVCSFPQDIDFVCTELPRKSVNAIRIVKHFKLKDGTIDSTTFCIRKDMVLKALRWLKKYNSCYHNITIKEENMDWMEGDNERDLEVDLVIKETETEKDTTFSVVTSMEGDEIETSISMNKTETIYTDAVDTKCTMNTSQPPQYNDGNNNNTLINSVWATDIDRSLKEPNNTDECMAAGTTTEETRCTKVECQLQSKIHCKKLGKTLL